jgi:hypothetical protein
LGYSAPVVYLGVLLLLLKIDRRLRLPVLAVLASVGLVFAAYATGGFFEYRYLASHTWCLWALSGWGFALVIPRVAPTRLASA